jgi:hypothetical protein
VQAAVSSARNYRSRGPGAGLQNARDRRNFRIAGGPHRGHGRGLLRRPGGTPRGEPSGPEGPLGVADSLPPAARIRRSPPCARPPGKARPARLCGRIGMPGFLPDFRRSAREERGCASAFAASKRRIFRVSNLFRPSHQCRKNSAGFLPEFCVIARAGRGCPSAFAARARRIIRVCNWFRPSPQCRNNIDRFLPEFCVIARAGRGCRSAFGLWDSGSVLLYGVTSAVGVHRVAGLLGAL